MGKSHYVLAADIGGTKSNLAIYENCKDLLTPLEECSFVSAEFNCLEDIVALFLKKSGLSVESACFGVAGPVVNNTARITKLPWVVDKAQLEKRFGFTKTHLINDLVATSYGLDVLPAKDIIQIKDGENDLHGPRAIVAPGTGLGEAFMLWDGKRYTAHATEGGHCLLGPANREQLALLVSLFENGVASYDTVCSGAGIGVIYDFLKTSKNIQELDWVEEALIVADDPAPVITKAASASNPSSLCVDTITMYVSLLAAESANFALKTMATGGVYLAGGIPPRILPFLERDFSRFFAGDGRPMQHVLERIPVKVVLNPKTALFGAASRVLGSD